MFDAKSLKTIAIMVVAGIITVYAVDYLQGDKQ